MDYLGGFLPKRKFPTPIPPTAVSFQSLTANGTSGTVSTTQLTATFDVDPGLTTSNFVVTGASKGVVSKVGAVYTININTITVDDGQSVTLDIIGVPSGFTITPTTRTVVVNKAASLEAPTFVFDLVFPELTEGDTGTFDASYCFAGEIGSYSIATGTLPAWLTFNTSTCVFTYTNAVFETISGLSITATNAAGSATTNTADWVVAEDVAGSGTLTTAPSPYYGYDQISTTGIITSIGFAEAPDGMTAPYTLIAYANTTLAGSRNLSSLPLNGYELAHHVWTLTKANGDPLDELYDEIYSTRYNSATGQIERTLDNVHTNTISPEFTDLILNHGGYKLTLKAYAMTSDGVNALVATDEHTFSIAKPTANYSYRDPVNGLNSNDGLDPLGLSLTNASYIESTGILTEAGKFAGLVLDNEPYDTDTTNFVHITGFGRARLAEVIDDNSARVDDRWRLGSDQTGLTSSNGPKQSLPTTNSANTVYCVRAGSYEIDSIIDFSNKTGEGGLYSIGGDSLLKSGAGWTATGSSSSNFLIAVGSPGTGAALRNKLMISRFDLDCQGLQEQAIRGGHGVASTSSVVTVRNIYRRTQQRRSEGFGSFAPSTPINDNTYHIINWGSFLDNKRVGDNGKGVSMYLNSSPNTYLRCIGVLSDTDSENSATHHHWYLDGYSNHLHVAWCYFRYGQNPNYCLNNNTAQTLGFWDRKYISIHNNWFGGAERAMDFGNASDADGYTFSNMFISRNQSRVNEDFTYFTKALSFFAGHNDHESLVGSQVSAFMRPAGALPVDASFTLARNQSSGCAFYNAGGRAFNIESFNNDNINTRATEVFQVRQADTTDRGFIYVSNRFYAPNTASLNLYQINGVTSDLASLNAVTGSSANTEEVITLTNWPAVLPNEIIFISAVANGEDGVTNSSEITMTFSEDPGAIAATDFTVTGATKGALSGTGTTRVLAITSVTAINGGAVGVSIADNNGNTFVPNNRSAKVYTSAPTRLYLNPATDTSALITFDVGASNDRVFGGQGVRFKLITSDVTTSFGGGLAKSGTDYFRFRPLLNSGNGAINIMQGGGFSQTSEFFINLPSQTVLWDGSEHIIKMPLVANAAVTVNIDGTNYAHATVTFGSAPQFDITYLRGGGNYYIYDLEVYDVTTDATIMMIDIDSGTLIGTESASVGTGTLTLNVSEGDWTDTPA